MMRVIVDDHDRAVVRRDLHPPLQTSESLQRKQMAVLLAPQWLAIAAAAKALCTLCLPGTASLASQTRRR